MFGYSEASIARRAAKRGQTVEEHLAYLLDHENTRSERRRNARNPKPLGEAVVDTPAEA